MKKILLDGTWRMTGGGYGCEGTIPGSLFSFLLNGGLMADPYYRDNELDALALTYVDYTFSRAFTVKKSDNPYILRFEGIDTLTDIYLNGKHISATDNMHVTYEFDVTEALLPGENSLEVVCHPIHDHIRKKADELDLYPSKDTLRGFAYIRKASCMLGWDWGPMLPDMGIWRSVYLCEMDSARITDFEIKQRHKDGRVFVTPIVSTDAEADVHVFVKAPGGRHREIPLGVESEIKNPKLWWPRTLGDQPLYEFEAVVIQDGEVASSEKKKIGLRTLKLLREKDKWGESFTHECNGIKFFAMGADYIPEDNIFSRITKERSRVLLKRCVDANFNAIRVWGGGYYPDNWFFELCDEMGLIVFLDLAFACSPILPDEKMLESIKVEIAQNTARLRHHPSLAVISGNNEIECAMEWVDPKVVETCKPVLIEVFEDIIPSILAKTCPDIPYICSSPVSCGHCIAPNNENYGDSHYWEVWHGGKPFTEYRDHYFRYLSEFGFQSFPSEKTVKEFTLPEDRNVFSRIMEMHQRNGSANAKIISYLSETFLYPTSFGSLLYASQLLQAESIKYAVEHMRSIRPRCMGTLYWQLNDIWPVASWASIDYYGRLKALHYYAKRFYSPLMISCIETGERTTRPIVTMQPDYYDYETRAALVLNNETLRDVCATARGYLRDATGKILETYEQTVTLPAQSTITLPEIDFNKTDVRRNYYSYELVVDNKIVSEGTVLFTAPKHFGFIDPELTVRTEGREIVVSAKAYAKSIEIYSDDSDIILSDNFFDINGGEKRVKILEGKAKGLKVRSVYDIR